MAVFRWVYKVKISPLDIEQSKLVKWTNEVWHRPKPPVAHNQSSVTIGELC